MKNQSTNHAAAFGGFILPKSNTNGEITMPVNWPEVAKAIDNIAELKIVQLVLWVTWGNGQADDRVPLSINDFIEVTGLCKRSVANGIKKAIAHGYINRQNCGDESNLCFYGINLANPQAQDLPNDVDKSMQDFPERPYLAPDEMQILPEENFASVDELAFEAFSDENANFASSSNELELPTHNYYNEDVSRIQEDQYVDSDQPIEPSPRKTKMGKYPAFLCARIEQFSQTLGDYEHTASNIGQAHHIYLDYIARGGNAKAFVELMQQAKEITQKKSCIRRKNQKNQRNAMPYFFACLKRACKESKDRIAA